MLEYLNNIPDEKLDLSKRNVKHFASKKDYTIDPFFNDTNSIIIVNGTEIKDITDFTVNIDSIEGQIGDVTLTRCVTTYNAPRIFPKTSFFVNVTNNEKNTNISYTCGYITNAIAYNRTWSINNVVSKSTVLYQAKICTIENVTTTDEIKAWAEKHADMLEHIEAINIAGILYVKLRLEYAEDIPKGDCE